MVEIVNFTKEKISKKYFREIGEIVLKKVGQPKGAEIKARSLCSRNLVSSSCSEIRTRSLRSRNLVSSFRSEIRTRSLRSRNLVSSSCSEIRTRSLRSRNLVSSSCSEISLVFVGDARMRALNKKYRDINKTTDVLSFFYGRERPGDIFGEIVISIPQAKKQSKEQSYPLKRELIALFVHGILHLVGYEDETEGGYGRMMDKQEEIIKSLVVSRF